MPNEFEGPQGAATGEAPAVSGAPVAADATVAAPGSPEMPPRTQAQVGAQSQPQAQYVPPAAQQPPYGQQPPAQPMPYAGAVATVPTTVVTQKKSHAWIVAIVLIVCLFAFTAFCVKSCSDAVSRLGGFGGADEVPDNAVAIIDISGTIQYDGTECSPEGLKYLLDQAESDDKIKAVVLRVNSGGGVATAGEEMAEYLRDFSKPVVVSSASINASAAYEISAQADYIYVAKSTEIGAIGTAMELTDLSGLLDMLGINMEVITSADSKDSSYGYRPLTDEEREYYQRMVDQINEMFIENVAIGRDMSIEEVRVLATGMAFTGVDAVENGLADGIGTLEDATDKAAELAGISNYNTYELGFSNYDLSLLYYLMGGQSSESAQMQPMLKN